PRDARRWAAGRRRVTEATVRIRAATCADDAALAALDRVSWSWLHSPSAPREPGTAFFDTRVEPGDVLVADAGGAVVGYVRIGPATPVPANEHVLMIRGVAVDPGWRGRGLGRRLVDGAVDEAARRGARRVTLRVLGT